MTKAQESLLKFVVLAIIIALLMATYPDEVGTPDSPVPTPDPVFNSPIIGVPVYPETPTPDRESWGDWGDGNDWPPMETPTPTPTREPDSQVFCLGINHWGLLLCW